MIKILSQIATVAGSAIVSIVTEASRRRSMKAKTDSKIRELEAEARIELARKKVDMVKNEQDARLRWDLLMAEATKTSSKDEIMMLAIVAPYIAIFIPFLQEHVISGFQALDKVPAWYLISFGVVVAASFGYRAVVDFYKR